MDEELHQLEAELKALRPAVPSRELLARLERDIPPSAHRVSRDWWRWAGVGLPVAAAVAIALVVTARRPRVPNAPVASSPTVAVPAETAPAFRPIGAENLLVEARDEGLVTLNDGTAARRERLRYVDTITWKNPRTNASVRWSVPREEVRVVPVNFQ